MAAYLLTEDMINSFIDEINTTQKENGGQIEIPASEEPDLGMALKAFIRTVEKGFITTFEPILELKDLIENYLTNPPEFLEKIKTFAEKIKNMASNPIETIVNELVKPISENLKIPIELDFTDLVPNLKISIDKGFKELPKEKQEQIKKMITPEFYEKIPQFFMFPIKMVIGIFKGIIEMIIDAITAPIPKIPELVINLISKFKETIIDLINTIMESILKPIFETIVPGGFNDIASVITQMKNMIMDALSGKEINVDEYKQKAPEFEKVFGFINIIVSFVKTILNFITGFPAMFFGSGALESVKNTKAIADTIDKMKKTKEDILKQEKSVKQLQNINPEKMTDEELKINQEKLKEKETQIEDIRNNLTSFIEKNLNKDLLEKVLDKIPKDLLNTINLNIELINFK